jgi:hypothetical protein
MSVTDPGPFLQDLDYELLERYETRSSHPSVTDVPYMEPIISRSELSQQSFASHMEDKSEDQAPQDTPRPGLPVINSKIVRLGEFIDTDAVRYILHYPIPRLNP